jgi:hypothetical protein
VSGQASPVVLRHREKSAPAAGAVLGALIALLILFQWMHFILAQGIESTGREIQVKTEELQRIERLNNELRRQISVAGSQEEMAGRSSNLGYDAQRPVYLLVDQPLPPASDSSRLTDPELAQTGNDGAQAAFGSSVDGPIAGGHGGD